MICERSIRSCGRAAGQGEDVDDVVTDERVNNEGLPRGQEVDVGDKRGEERNER